MDVIGKDGKPVEDTADSNTLWSIEVTFNYANEVRLHKVVNVTNADLTKFRNYIFSHGLMYWIDPGHWVLVPPSWINTIDVFKQKGKHNNY